MHGNFLLCSLLFILLSKWKKSFSRSLFASACAHNWIHRYTHTHKHTQRTGQFWTRLTKRTSLKRGPMSCNQSQPYFSINVISWEWEMFSDLNLSLVAGSMISHFPVLSPSEYHHILLITWLPILCLPISSMWSGSVLVCHVPQSVQYIGEPQ